VGNRKDLEMAWVKSCMNWFEFLQYHFIHSIGTIWREGGGGGKEEKQETNLEVFGAWIGTQKWVGREDTKLLEESRVQYLPTVKDLVTNQYEKIIKDKFLYFCTF
jgi:hypothetical protein